MQSRDELSLDGSWASWGFSCGSFQSGFQSCGGAVVVHVWCIFGACVVHVVWLQCLVRCDKNSRDKTSHVINGQLLQLLTAKSSSPSVSQQPHPRNSKRLIGSAARIAFPISPAFTWPYTQPRLSIRGGSMEFPPSHGPCR